MGIYYNEIWNLRYWYCKTVPQKTQFLPEKLQYMTTKNIKAIYRSDHLQLITSIDQILDIIKPKIKLYQWLFHTKKTVKSMLT